MLRKFIIVTFQLLATSILLKSSLAQHSDTATSIRLETAAASSTITASMSAYGVFCNDEGKPDSSAFSVLNFSNGFNLGTSRDPLDSLADSFASSYLIVARGLKKNPQPGYYSTMVKKWSNFFAALGIPEDLFNRMGNTSNPTEQKQLAKLIRQKLASVDPSDCTNPGGWFSRKSGCGSMILRFTNANELKVKSFIPLNGDGSPPPGSQKNVSLKGPAGEGTLCEVN